MILKWRHVVDVCKRPSQANVKIKIRGTGEELRPHCMGNLSGCVWCWANSSFKMGVCRNAGMCSPASYARHCPQSYIARREGTLMHHRMTLGTQLIVIGIVSMPCRIWPWRGRALQGRS